MVSRRTGLFYVNSCPHLRYGDPIDPVADLQSMRWMWRSLSRMPTPAATLDGPQSGGGEELCSLTPGAGLAFFSVPVGADLVVWNLHRRYGPIRLPLLLADFCTLSSVGLETRRLNENQSFRKSYEPIFVLTSKLNSHQSSQEATYVFKSHDDTPSGVKYVE